MSFFNELKRRNVFRVGAAYLVVAWLVLQIIDTVGPIIALSDGFARGVLLMLAVGFPIALVVSWVFELTPEGITTQENVDAGAKTTSGRKLNAVIIGGLALALVFVVLDSYVLRDEGTTGPAPVATIEEDNFQGEITQTTGLENSIVVLPFVNQSGNPDQDYFSDGLTEELINKLSQVQDLLVIGRNSSFYFKDRDEDLREIGEVLDVSYVLQGSVRMAGEQLRVTAQLMESGSGFNVWSRSFDRTLADVFAIQDEIARDVATNLSVTLGIGEFDRPGMTRNLQAYDAYLQALQIDREGFRPGDALEKLKQAVALDREFGLAWARMYEVYFVYLLTQPSSDTERLLRERQDALEQAFDVAPDMPEILAIKAVEESEVRGNWQEADWIFRELYENHGFTNARLNSDYGTQLAALGKASESIPYLQRAARIDPMAGLETRLSVVLLSLGREAEALELVDKLMAQNIQILTPFLTAIRAMAAYARDDAEAAIAAFSLNEPDSVQRRYTVPVLELIAAGDREGAHALLASYLEQDLPPMTYASGLGVIGMLNDGDLGMDFWEFEGRVFSNYGSFGLWQRSTSVMRQTERFKERVQRDGLVDYWKATGWGDFCRPIAGTENDFECH